MKNNKKGFTLVELLAVIVILALIMGIAVVSIGGVLSSSRENTFRETAASLINAVRQKKYLDGSIKKGVYKVGPSVLERGGVNSPYGNAYLYDCNDGVCELDAAPQGGCTKDSKAYVTIEESGDNYTYSICLADGEHYVDDSETNLLNGTTAKVH